MTLPLRNCMRFGKGRRSSLRQPAAVMAPLPGTSAGCQRSSVLGVTSRTLRVERGK
jgi:hypothetical protein